MSGPGLSDVHVPSPSGIKVPSTSDPSDLPGGALATFRDGVKACKADDPEATPDQCNAAGWAAVRQAWRQGDGGWVKKSLAERVEELVDEVAKYSDDQPRADDGKWTSGGGGSSARRQTGPTKLPDPPGWNRMASARRPGGGSYDDGRTPAGDSRASLTQHGWSHTTDDANGASVYGHGGSDAHEITVHPNGSWTHTAPGAPVTRTNEQGHQAQYPKGRVKIEGTDAASLTAHLKAGAVVPGSRESIGKVFDGVAKAVGDQRLVFGFANCVVKDERGQVIEDRQGDRVDLDHLERCAYDWVRDARESGVMHVGKADGGAVESMVFTEEKIAKMFAKVGVSPEATCEVVAKLAGKWWIGTEVPQPVFDRVVRGELRAFSIEGTGSREALAA